MGAQVIDFAEAVNRLDEKLVEAVRRRVLAILSQHSEESMREPEPAA